MLDVRIAVAKIVDAVQLETVLKSVPVVQADANWDCMTWLKNALAALDTSGCLGTRRLGWKLVKQTGRDYVKRKLAVRRSDGRVAEDANEVTTHDLMEAIP